MLTQLSLRKKLVLTYMFIILIPIVIFTLYYSEKIYKDSIQEITKKNEYLLEIERNQIKNNIETMRRTAQMVISDRRFIEYIKTHYESNIEDFIDFKMNALSNITKLQFNNPTIEYIHFYTNNPNIAEMWPIIFDEKRIKDKPWYNEVISRNGMEFWSFADQDEDLLNRFQVFNRNSKISLLREIDYPQGEYIGVIEISMLLKNFFPKMYSSVGDGQSEIVVLDSQMNIYQNPNHQFLEEQHIDSNFLKQQFLHAKKKDTTSFQFTNQGIPYLGVSTYLADIEAYMLIVISLQEIYAQINHTTKLVIIGVFALLVILSIISYIIISLLLKKMHQLIDSMKHIAKGDFSINVDVYGNGEIAELARNFQVMLGKINGLIADMVNKQAATKEAELKALKTQIDSHFLYNTLENIKMMAEIEGKYDISDALTSLGEMMRYNLKWKNDFVLLAEELNHIRNYIDIMNLRLDQRLQLILNIPEELLEQEIIKMSLQPIVENAVKHGIGPKLHASPGIIEISAAVQGDTVVIEVTDNGIGISLDKLDRLNKYITIDEPVEESMNKKIKGIGLRNVNERIKFHYGEEYQLHVESLEGQYTKVWMQLPLLIIKGGRKHVSSVNR